MLHPDLHAWGLDEEGRMRAGDTVVPGSWNDGSVGLKPTDCQARYRRRI